jgi:hypothetical protein
VLVGRWCDVVLVVMGLVAMFVLGGLFVVFLLGFTGWE